MKTSHGRTQWDDKRPTKATPAQADPKRLSATAINSQTPQKMPKPLYPVRGNNDLHPQRAITKRGIEERTTYRQ